jgi:hypothetical protein
VVKRRPEKPENADIEFTADVKARELRFEEVPETEVRFPGRPERESASGTDRENLPDEVEPGVTYRDPTVRLRIATALTDADGQDEDVKAATKKENR